jgi:hypothetical protein
LFALPRLQSSFIVDKLMPKQMLFTGVILIVCIAILALIAIYSHGEIEGSQKRFE